MDLRGERGSERTRLSAFAAAVRGEPAARLPDFADALRVAEVIETIRTSGLRPPAKRTVSR